MFHFFMHHPVEYRPKTV